MEMKKRSIVEFGSSKEEKISAQHVKNERKRGKKAASEWKIKRISLS
jgi:hypothetical protein